MRELQVILAAGLAGGAILCLINGWLLSMEKRDTRADEWMFWGVGLTIMFVAVIGQ